MNVITLKKFVTPYLTIIIIPPSLIVCKSEEEGI